MMKGGTGQVMCFFRMGLVEHAHHGREGSMLKEKEPRGKLVTAGRGDSWAPGMAGKTFSTLR